MGGGGGFDVVHAHQTKLDNINKVVDNNTSMRIFNRYHPLQDTVSPLPGHNITPVKPYYGGTKTMYQRENSGEYNTKALIKTGMRDAGAYIVSPLSPEPTAGGVTPHYQSTGMKSPIANPSFISHSHSKPNIKEVSEMTRARENQWEKNYAALVEKRSVSNQRQSERGGSSHPHLKS